MAKQTAAEKAQAALDVATRRVDKLVAAIEHQKGLVKNYQEQLEVAVAKRDYAAQNPDLKSFESSHKAPDPDPEF